MTIDTAQLKDAAAGRGAEIFTAVGGLSPDRIDGRHGPCPKCGGTDRFRVLDVPNGICFCNNCFNQKNGDVIAAIMWLTESEFPAACNRIAQHLGLNGHANGRPHVDVMAAVCQQKRMPIEAAKAFGAHLTGSTVVFPCYGPEGEVCTTYRIWIEDHKATKGIFEKDKPAGLFFAHDADGNPRLPVAGETIVLAFSVKDAVALHAIGYQSVSLPGCDLAAKFVRLFRDVHVLMIPHRTATEYAKADKNTKRFNWAIEGHRKWRESGLGTPEDIDQATNSYRCEMDVIGQFISECCIVSDSCRVRAKSLHDAYRDWIGDGAMNMNQMRFGLAITDRGYAKEKSNGVWYTGIGLRESEPVGANQKQREEYWDR